MSLTLTSVPRSRRDRYDCRPHGLYEGTGRANAVRSTDARCGGTFGLIPPAARHSGRAMARLEDALKVRPKGWSVSEEYIAPRELEIVAVLKRKEAEKKRAAQQATARVRTV